MAGHNLISKDSMSDCDSDTVKKREHEDCGLVNFELYPIFIVLNLQNGFPTILKFYLCCRCGPFLSYFHSVR